MIAGITQIGYWGPAVGGKPAIRLVIPASAVGSDQAVYKGYADMADFQAFTDWLALLEPSGVNIQVWNEAMTEEMDRHVNISVDLSTGEIHYVFTNLSSLIDNVFILYPSNMSADYAVTDPHGRNNCFKNGGYESYWGFTEDPSGAAPQLTDWTGNGRDGTTGGGMVSGNLVAGPNGMSAWEFTTDDYVQATQIGPGQDNFTATGWYYLNDNSVNAQLMGVWNQSTSAQSWRIIYASGSGALLAQAKHGGPVKTLFGNSTPNGVWVRATFVFIRNTGTRLYQNGSLVDSLGAGNASLNGAAVGLYMAWQYDIATYAEARFAAFRVKLTSNLPDLESIEYNNENDPANFYSSITQINI